MPSTFGTLPQGIDKISIYDISAQKDEYGSVMLVASRGNGADSDKVPLVDDHGSNIKVSELGKFLLSDGSIVMSESGRAFRPGDDLVAPSLSKNGVHNHNVSDFAVNTENFAVKTKAVISS